jgi:hypothetical protein
MVNDYLNGKCVDECVSPNSYLSNYELIGTKIPRCDYCSSFDCIKCKEECDDCDGNPISVCLKCVDD